MFVFSRWKGFYKTKFFVHLMFWSVTLVMLASRYASFYTYSGDDDLHYAFLSSKILNSNYDIFFANDIFSARAAIVLYQAIWFRLFGINDFSMCMPALSLLIISAYFVCFKFELQKNIYTTVLASSLIYFNPVVTRATLGNLPDVYLALIAVLVFYLIKKNTDCPVKRQNILSGIFAGLLLIAGLFVKESIILIYAGAAATLFFYRNKLPGYFIIALVSTVLIGSAGYLVYYYINTGSFIYHFEQIKNSAYFNPCSYDCLPKIYLLKRLTITVPLHAVLTGAWPLLLLAPVLIACKPNKTFNTRFWATILISLTLLALYFPFSIFPYVPLCDDMRQFFFLFPVACILYLSCLQEIWGSAKSAKAFTIAGSIVFAAVTLICIFFTPYNKWGIFCNSLLALLFIGNTFSNKKLQRFLLYLIIPVILWLGTAYPIFKKPHQGYSELKALYGKLKQEKNFSTNTYYFLNNDTRSHFALINQFDPAKRFLNLDTVQKGFKPFIAYQRQDAFTGADSTQKGWLIVSDNYYENLDSGKIKSINHLLAEMQCYSKINKTSAYYLISAETVKKIMNIVNVNTDDGGCY